MGRVVYEENVTIETRDLPSAENRLRRMPDLMPVGLQNFLRRCHQQCENIQCEDK